MQNEVASHGGGVDARSGGNAANFVPMRVRVHAGRLSDAVVGERNAFDEQRLPRVADAHVHAGGRGAVDHSHNDRPVDGLERRYRAQGGGDELGVVG